MSTDMDDNQGGGVGAFAEEEANKKRLKKLESVSKYSTFYMFNCSIILTLIVLYRGSKLIKQLTRPSDTSSMDRSRRPVD